MTSRIRVGDAEVEFDRGGAGPDLLLVHSLLTEMTVFDTVLPALACSRRVTRINLPGCGTSSPVHLETIAAYADHVARVMEALDLPASTDVFGNGFGAFVVAELAIRHGTRFHRLIAADVVAAFPEPAREPFRVMASRVREGGMASILDTAIGRMFPPEFAAQHADVVAQRRRMLAAVDASCFAQACLGLAALDLRPRLPSVRNRTLVLCGSLDRTTPPELAREFSACVAGSRYEDIPGSGHCPMLEQPERLVAAIEGFLASPA